MYYKRKINKKTGKNHRFTLFYARNAHILT